MHVAHPIRRVVITTATILGLAGGSAAVAGAAGATTTGHPGDGGRPSVSPFCLSRDGGQQYGADWHKRPVPCPVTFDLQLANDYRAGTSFNDVTWLGPRRLALIGGRDTESSGGTASVFASTTTADAIDLSHSASLGTGVVDRRTCSVFFSLAGSPWTATGGAGIFTGLTGSGVYDLTAGFSFGDNRRGVCSLTGLTDAQVLALIASGDPQSNGPAQVVRGVVNWCRHHHRPVPVLNASDVFVQGAGTAIVPRQHKPYPTPTPSVTVSVTATV